MSGDPNSQHIIDEKNAEIARLRNAICGLLNSVNARHPEKQPHEWSCPHMAELDRLVNH